MEKGQAFCLSLFFGVNFEFGTGVILNRVWSGRSTSYERLSDYHTPKKIWHA